MMAFLFLLALTTEKIFPIRRKNVLFHVLSILILTSKLSSILRIEAEAAAAAPAVIASPCRLKEYYDTILITDHLNNGSSKSAITIILEDGHSFLRTDKPFLSVLDLSHCQIKEIRQAAFHGGENLTEIHLNNNLIEQLDPSVFSELPQLKFLTLSSNPLKHFKTGSGNVFPILSSLKNLQLSRCNITSLKEPLLFTNLKELETLNLSHNRIRNATWKAFAGLPKLKNVNLHGNPWHCDCHVGFLKNFFEERKISYGFSSSTKSNYPSCESWPNSSMLLLNKSMKWIEIHQEHLICPPSAELRRTEEERNDNDSEDFSIATATSTRKDVRLECNYSGYEQPEVRWFKNGELLSLHNPRIRVVSQWSVANLDTFELFGVDEMDTNFSQSLIIRNFHVKEDEGAYKCVASNSGGTVASNSVQINLIRSSSNENEEPKTKAKAVLRNENSSISAAVESKATWKKENLQMIRSNGKTRLEPLPVGETRKTFHPTKQASSSTTNPPPTTTMALQNPLTQKEENNNTAKADQLPTAIAKETGNATIFNEIQMHFQKQERKTKEEEIPVFGKTETWNFWILISTFSVLLFIAIFAIGVFFHYWGGSWRRIRKNRSLRLPKRFKNTSEDDENPLDLIL